MTIPQKTHFFLSAEMIFGLSMLICQISSFHHEGLFLIITSSVFMILLISAFARRKADEREKYLHFKAATFMIAPLIITMYLVWRFLPNGEWFSILMSSMFFFHGLSGNIIFARE